MQIWCGFVIQIQSSIFRVDTSNSIDEEAIPSDLVESSGKRQERKENG
jgi:hypothetical protein